VQGIQVETGIEIKYNRNVPADRLDSFDANE